MVGNKTGEVRESPGLTREAFLKAMGFDLGVESHFYVRCILRCRAFAFRPRRSSFAEKSLMLLTPKFIHLLIHPSIH